MDPHERVERDGREALAQYREGERMPPLARDAAWARLQASIARSERPAALARETGGSARLLWAAALLLAAAGVLALATRGRGLQPRDGGGLDNQAQHEVGPAAPRRVQPGERAAGFAGTTSEAQEDPADGSTTAPVVERPRNPRAAFEAQPSASDLAAELALLHDARAALAAGDGAGALRRLGEHARRFRSSALVEERSLLRVQALCAVGRTTQAREAARTFARHYPDSPHTRTMVSICPT